MKLVIDGDPTPDHLLDRDRQLESLSGLTRRQVLILFANMVAASGGISVLGCSSGTPTGSNPPPPPNTGTNTSLPQVNGTVVLPSGSTLSTNTLTLQSMGQRIPLPSAAFGIGVSPNSPSLALVTDTHGNGIMAGFLDVTGAIPPAITPHSTGVVLSWFALGGPFVPANLKAQLLSLLDADPTMSTLGGVMASRIAADPLAVVNGDAQIATALNTALDALNNGATSTISPESLRDDPPPTIKVSPTVAQGGVSVRLDNAIVGVDIANTYRRPVQVYVYEVQTKTLIGTSEVPTDISPAKLVAGPFDMGEPTAFTALGGLLAFLAQPAPFKSVTLGPIGLGLDGTSD
ncbi:MAG: hypothetical protein ACRELE_10860, partial [Gemmatimonadales bacterium]